MNSEADKTRNLKKSRDVLRKWLFGSKSHNKRAFLDVYSDLSGPRNIDVAGEFISRLKSQDKGECEIFWVTGYPGCGKTTELLWIKENASDEYEVIYIDLHKELDVNKASYIDLYIIIFREIEKLLRQHNQKMDSSLREKFESWFSEIITEMEDGQSSILTGEASVSIGHGVPLLAQLLAKLTSQMKREVVSKTKVVRKLERNIISLESYTNQILKEALSKLSNLNPDLKGFLVIFDQLEMLSQEKSKHLFRDYINYFERLSCNIIFTASVDAIYRSEGAYSLFHEIYFIPSANVYQNWQSSKLEVDKKKIRDLINFLGNYMTVDSIFESTKDLEMLVWASGGCPKQLMLLTIDSMEIALRSGADVVREDSIKKAFKRFILKLDRKAQNGLFFEQLKDVYFDRVAPKDNINGNIFEQLLAFEYLDSDGYSRWSYINPLLIYVREFKRLVDKERC